MLLDVLGMGGPVMWIIFACGLAAFGVFVERALHLHRARITVEDFLGGIITVLKRGNTEEALAICSDTPGPAAHLVKTAIQHRKDAGGRLRTTIEEAALGERSRLERRLVVVATVAQITPLLGLLGTILGMIEAVIVMQQQAPLVQSMDLMSGLLRALITTGGGLIVAIPSYVAFNLLVLKIDRIVLDMDRAASEIVAFLGEMKGNQGE